MVKTRINWRPVLQLMAIKHWRWADLAREMGYAESQISEVRHGKKNLTLGFAECLVEATGIGYADILIHPNVKNRTTARERLHMDTTDDGKPWPVAYSSKPIEPRRPQFNYRRYLRERQLEADVDTFK